MPLLCNRLLGAEMSQGVAATCPLGNSSSSGLSVSSRKWGARPHAPLAEVLLALLPIKSFICVFYWAELKQGSLRVQPTPLSRTSALLQSSVALHSSDEWLFLQGWLTHWVDKQAPVPELIGRGGWGWDMHIKLGAMVSYFNPEQHPVKPHCPSKFPLH